MPGISLPTVQSAQRSTYHFCRVGFQQGLVYRLEVVYVDGVNVRLSDVVLEVRYLTRHLEGNAERCVRWGRLVPAHRRPEMSVVTQALYSEAAGGGVGGGGQGACSRGLETAMSRRGNIKSPKPEQRGEVLLVKYKSITFY